jgi:hypothetical protein
MKKTILLTLMLPCLLSGCAHQPTPEERLQESATKLLENYLDLLNDQIEQERERVKRGEESRFPPR